MITPMQLTAIFHDCKNGNFQIENYDIFIINGSKHRPLVLIKTASSSNEYPRSIFQQI